MCRHADATSTPAVFAVSLLFGGGSGALIAAAVGLHGGIGFILGASLAFLVFWASVLRPRSKGAVELEPLPTEAGLEGAPRFPAAAEPTSC